VEGMGVARQRSRTVNGMTVSPDTQSSLREIRQDLFAGMIQKPADQSHRSAHAAGHRSTRQKHFSLTARVSVYQFMAAVPIQIDGQRPVDAIRKGDPFASQGIEGIFRPVKMEAAVRATGLVVNLDRHRDVPSSRTQPRYPAHVYVSLLHL